VLKRGREIWTKNISVSENRITYQLQTIQMLALTSAMKIVIDVCEKETKKKLQKSSFKICHVCPSAIPIRPIIVYIYIFFVKQLYPPKHRVAHPSLTRSKNLAQDQITF